MMLIPRSLTVVFFLLMVAGGAPTAQARGMEPTAVEIAYPITQAMPEEISVTGTLIANEWVRVSPEIAGTIRSLPFEEGGRIAKGDLLLELDDALLKAEFRQAQASYKLAELRHRRNSQLIKKKSISESTYDESAAELNERKAALEVAQVKLDKARILAPFDGFISLRYTSVGAYVTPGEKLFILVDDSPLRLDFRVPERLVSTVKPGTQVTFEVNLQGGAQSYEAVVSATQPAITPESRTLLARALFANDKRQILAGSFAKVKLTLGAEEPVLTVPEQALIGKEGGYKIYIVEDGKAQGLTVVTGVRRDGRVAIISGLDEGLPVIVAGHQMVGDGSPVNVVDVRD